MSKIKVNDLNICETETTEDCNVVGGFFGSSYYSLLSLYDFEDYNDNEKSPQENTSDTVVAKSPDGKLFAKVVRGKVNGREFARSTASARN